MFRVVKHGKLYKVDVIFPHLQVEGACVVSGKVKEFLIDETCSFVETFRKLLPIELRFGMTLKLFENKKEIKKNYSHFLAIR